MKKCSRCKEEKDELEFNKKSGRTSQTYCKDCQSIKHLEWYEKNKIKRKEQIYNRRREITQWLYEQKEKIKMSCSICGEDRFPTLDFHHRDSSEKEYNIGSMAHRGLSKENILKEIEKCDILCSNCHRILHYNEKII